MSQVHPLARTTPHTRAEIKASSAPLTVLAERYNITEATARKWKHREDSQDHSHRPHKLSSTLHPLSRFVWNLTSQPMRADACQFRQRSNKR